MEQQIERGKEWLEGLLQLMGLPAAVKVGNAGGEADSRACWLIIDQTDLTAEQTKILIGDGGKGIDAIQYLANALINLGVEPEAQRAFTLELGGYRVRRQAQLKALAEQVVQQVRQTRQQVEIKSLSSAERRQIHTFLQDAEDLETESQGQEPDRRLVVRLR